MSAVLEQHHDLGSRSLPHPAGPESRRDDGRRLGRVAAAATLVIASICGAYFLPFPGTLIIGSHNIQPFILPVLLTMAAIEGLYLQRRPRGYCWKTWLASAADELVRPFAELIHVELFGAFFPFFYAHRLFTLPAGPVWSFILAFFMIEFAAYAEHWLNHRVRFCWASHAVHHSSNEISLIAGLRLGWTLKLCQAALVYLPLLLLGVRPDALFLVSLIGALYNFWLHNALVPRLGWLEYVINTPGHHRVHHATEEPYRDKNYGRMLIIFDRLLGTYAEDKPGEQLTYGLVTPLKSNNPLVIASHEWVNMIRDVRSAQSWGERFCYVFARPGWRPARLRTEAAG